MKSDIVVPAVLAGHLPVSRATIDVGALAGRAGVEFVEDRTTKKPLRKEACRGIFDEALKRGLITMAYSPALRINPPLNITEAEAAQQRRVAADRRRQRAPRG